MGTTLGTLKARMRARLHNRTDKDPQIVEALNDAQTRIARIRDWREMQAATMTFTFTDGLQDYAVADVAASAKTLLAITIIDPVERTLDWIDWRWMDSLIPDPAAQTEGQPETWYQQNKGTFSVYPIPDATYTARIRYTTWASELSDDAHQLALTNMDDVVIAAAMTDVYLGMQEYEDAAVWENRFRGLVMEAERHDQFDPARTIVLGRYMPPGARPPIRTDPQRDPWYGIRRR